MYIYIYITWYHPWNYGFKKIHLEAQLDSAGVSWIPNTEVSSEGSDVYVSRLQETHNRPGRLKWRVGILEIWLHCFMPFHGSFQ